MALPFAEGENYSSGHGKTCMSPVLDGEFVVPEKPLDGCLRGKGICGYTAESIHVLSSRDRHGRATIHRNR